MCLLPISCQGPEDSYPLPIKIEKKGNAQIFKSVLLALFFFFFPGFGLLLEGATIKMVFLVSVGM